MCHATDDPHQAGYWDIIRGLDKGTDDCPIVQLPEDPQLILQLVTRFAQCFACQIQ